MMILDEPVQDKWTFFKFDPVHAYIPAMDDYGMVSSVLLPPIHLVNEVHHSHPGHRSSELGPGSEVKLANRATVTRLDREKTTTKYCTVEFFFKHNQIPKFTRGIANLVVTIIKLVITLYNFRQWNNLCI